MVAHARRIFQIDATLPPKLRAGMLKRTAAAGAALTRATWVLHAV